MNGKPRDMDINFAIKVLSTAKVVTDSMHENPKRYGYQNQTFYDIARKMATQALKKQIPKKPDLEGDGYDDNGNLIYDTWICPYCEAHYEVDYDIYNHCPKCGQAIDRSDIE